ncbi:unnamed protein product [Rhizophagus irregularis]|nr:unnamed protein product [Rhizophagus irregularis]
MSQNDDISFNNSTITVSFGMGLIINYQFYCQPTFPQKNLRKARCLLLVIFVSSALTRGEAEKDIFPVEIDNNLTVENLGDEIRKIRGIDGVLPKDFLSFSVEDINRLKGNPTYLQYDGEIGPIHVIVYLQDE